MKNKNLTIQQIAILETLTNEFIKLNVVPEKKNSLIDFSDIIEETKKEDNFKKECELERVAFYQMLWAQRKLDAESLNDDLKELGFTTLIEKNVDGFYIVPIGSDKGEAYDNYTEIKIHYKTSHTVERKYNKLQNNIPCRYKVGIQSRNQSYSDQYFPTFQGLISSDYFKSRLKSVYQQSLRPKKNQ